MPKTTGLITTVFISSTISLGFSKCLFGNKIINQTATLEVEYKCLIVMEIKKKYLIQLFPWIHGIKKKKQINR